MLFPLDSGFFTTSPPTPDNKLTGYLLIAFVPCLLQRSRTHLFSHQKSRGDISNSFQCFSKIVSPSHEHRYLISMLDTFTLEYRPNETENLTTNPELQRRVHEQSIRALAKAAGVSTKTVKAARRGERLRKSTIDKLEKVLSSQFATTEPRSEKDTQFRLDDPE